MKLETAALLLPLILFPASACNSPGLRKAEAHDKQESALDEQGLANLKRKVHIAELQLSYAKLELQSHQEESAEAIRLAEEELALAQGRSDQFMNLDMRNKVERSTLALQRSRDRATESDEELLQLEIMYKDQELDDMTSEFVINRGKRDHERTQRSLAVQERAHESLTQHDVPREKKTLELDLVRKQRAVASANVSSEGGNIQKEIAVLKAQAELEKLQKELGEAEESKE